MSMMLRPLPGSDSPFGWIITVPWGSFRVSVGIGFWRLLMCVCVCVSGVCMCTDGEWIRGAARLRYVSQPPGHSTAPPHMLVLLTLALNQLCMNQCMRMCTQASLTPNPCMYLGCLPPPSLADPPQLGPGRPAVEAAHRSVPHVSGAVTVIAL